ncbi:Protein CBG14175 [Caenorhabditis briggsae]|uniref:Protein CBG14175 n=1 Tax=Caenorhabditis briggsae TaxID=6238 RepID=A8XJG1_CAEBR|nr:Protein CBG14175 [Caenorhabditis briggsae]CAP32786.2 Protein CBG14175 [Caenorhabditis briggsae]
MSGKENRIQCASGAKKPVEPTEKDPIKDGFTGTSADKKNIEKMETEKVQRRFTISQPQLSQPEPKEEPREEPRNKLQITNYVLQEQYTNYKDLRTIVRRALCFLRKYSLEKSIELGNNYRPPNLAGILLGKNFGSEPFTTLEDRDAGAQLRNQLLRRRRRELSKEPSENDDVENKQSVPADAQTTGTPEGKEDKSNGKKNRERLLKSSNGSRTAAIKNSETRKNGHFGDSKCETDEEEETTSLKNRLRNAVVLKQNNMKSSEDSSGNDTAVEDHVVEIENLRRIRRARVIYSPSPVERFSTRRQEKKRSTDEEKKQKSNSDEEEKRRPLRFRRARVRPLSAHVKKPRLAESESESSEDEEAVAPKACGRNFPESSLKASLSRKISLRKRSMQRNLDQTPSASEPSRKKRCEKESDSDSEYNYEEDESDDY